MFSTEYIHPKDNSISRHRFSGHSATLGLAALCSLLLLSSCHFGDAEDGLVALAKKKRELDYSVRMTMPTIAASRDVVQDLGPDGLNLNWGNSAAIAVFGDEFVLEKDSSDASVRPAAIELSYDRYLNASALSGDSATELSFDFSAYARHGYGESYATLVNFVYPYSLALDTDGDTLQTDTDSLLFTFTGQDGKLSTLRSQYLVALGRTRAVCSQNEVTVRDSLAEDAIVAESADMTSSDAADSDDDTPLVHLTPKVAVVRLSLVVEAQRNFTLLEYVKSRNMSDNGLYVDHIVLSNLNADAAGISRTALNLNSGWMQPQSSAVTSLTISDSKYFWDLSEIASDDAQYLGAQGNYLTSWGTSVYVAIPCTQEGVLDWSPQIAVYLRQTGSQLSQDQVLYGRIDDVQLQEGGYYITSPIGLVSDVSKVEQPACICKVP